MSAVAPALGLAVGALAAGALVQHGPAPRQLVFWLLFGAFLLAAASLAVVPETVPYSPGWLRVVRPRIGVSPAARATFLAVTPIVVAGWALTGFYLSLGPSLTASLTGGETGWWPGFRWRRSRRRRDRVAGHPALVRGQVRARRRAPVRRRHRADDRRGRGRPVLALPGRQCGRRARLRPVVRRLAAGARPAGRADRARRAAHRRLRHLIPRLQRAGAGRGRAHHPRRPARGRQRLRRGDRRPRPDRHRHLRRPARAAY